MTELDRRASDVAERGELLYIRVNAVAAAGFPGALHPRDQSEWTKWDIPVQVFEKEPRRDTIARLRYVASHLQPGFACSYMAVRERNFIVEQDATRHTKVGTVPRTKSLLLRRQSDDGTADWSILCHRLPHRRNDRIVFRFWVSLIH